MKDWRVHQVLTRWPRFFGLAQADQTSLVRLVQSLIAEAKAETREEASLLGEISKRIEMPKPTTEESKG